MSIFLKYTVKCCNAQAIVEDIKWDMSEHQNLAWACDYFEQAQQLADDMNWILNSIGHVREMTNI